jgi:AraC-like DNA-binding protein
MTGSHPLARTDHVSDYGRWTLFRRRPSPWLAPEVRQIQGYVEEGGPSVLRKEVPTGIVPLIVVFGPGFSLHDVRQPNRWRPLDRSFVAGLHGGHVLVGSLGNALCMQVDFTPWGARRFLGVDMCELADKVIDLDAIVGSFADRLEERLEEADSWDARFEILEQMLARRMTRVSAECPLVKTAWSAIERSRGEMRIGALARHLGCSRKHLAALFGREVGQSPKTSARIIRFGCALRELRAGRYSSLAELAVSCGYADQAHFNRDFFAFTGESPSALRERMLPDGTGIMAKRVDSSSIRAADQV